VPAAAPATNIAKGVLFMSASAVVFPLMNVLVKLLSANYPTLEIVWARNLSHLIFIVMVFMPRVGWRLVLSRRLGSQFVRSLLMLMSTSLFFTAMATVPLAEAAAINFTAPFLVALLAIPFLGERIDWWQWTAIGFGFLGALVVIRPGTGALPWQSIFVVGSTLAYSAYQVFTRRVSGYDTPETSAFYSALVGTLVLSVAVPFVWRSPESALDGVVLVSLGIFGGLGHYFVARAFMCGPAPVISPINYVQLIGASGLGYLVFGDLPTAWTWIGAAIIVVSGLAIAFRERGRGR
jgi:drug/metabolite transporter (DMT)-like permease